MTIDLAPIRAGWRTAVDEMEATLTALSDERARRRPAPEKWSVKEIVGHLVDSAANNHRRFVIAQLRDGLVFEGYEQNGWVERQQYQESAWPELVTLWATYNRHLIAVTGAIPQALLDRPQREHNLDAVSMRPVPRDEPARLGAFIDDYVFHLEHHLKQIRALLA